MHLFCIFLTPGSWFLDPESELLIDSVELFLRKEVIQPQVPLRLPCYDFIPVTDPTVVSCLPYGLAHRLKVKPTPMM